METHRKKTEGEIFFFWEINCDDFYFPLNSRWLNDASIAFNFNQVPMMKL